jgi:nitrogen fixation NifU-like protein
MSELRELYQEVILDHSKRPRNARFPEPSNRSCDGYNPLCGDRLTVKLYVDDAETIRDIGFQGSGCAISQAAASTMTEAVKGKTVEQARVLFRQFHTLVTRGPDALTDADLDALDKLAVFSGVSEYPMRVKCATLPWHTLDSALEHRESATTE